MQSYNNLKKQVTSKKLDPEVVVTPKKEPKLRVTNIDINCKKGFTDRSFQPHKQQRSRTEGCQNNLSLCRVNNDKTLRIKLRPHRVPKENGYKKYDELSLNEKVQFEGEPNRYSMLMKLGEMVGRKNSTTINSRKPSDDYSLQGWQ